MYRPNDPDAILAALRPLPRDVWGWVGRMVGLEGGIAGVDVRMRWAWDGCLEGGIYAESGRVLGGPILGAFSSRVVNTLWGFDGGGYVG